MTVSDYKNSFLAIKGTSSSYHSCLTPSSPSWTSLWVYRGPQSYPSPSISLIFISTKFQLYYYHYNILPLFLLFLFF